MRSAAWRRSSRRAAIRRSTSSRSRGCARTSCASRATASTAPGSPIPTSCRSRPRSSTACSATGRTSSSGCARTSCPTRRALVDFDDPRRRDHRGGLRGNVSVGARYLDAWLHGTGAAAIDNLMEDVATAEIARSQVWSWVHAGRFSEAEVRARARARSTPATEAKRLFAEVALARGAARVPDASAPTRGLPDD